MSKALHALGLAAVVAVAGGLGFFSYQALQPKAIAANPAVVDFALPDTSGKLIATSDYKGKWLLINFWATWCPPCVEEMPLLSEVNSRYPNMAIVGVALDNVDAINAFSDRVPVNFPLLVAETNGSAIGRQLGNSAGSLPYTVLVDPAGNIAKRWLGPIKADLIDDELSEFLR